MHTSFPLDLQTLRGISKTEMFMKIINFYLQFFQILHNKTLQKFAPIKTSKLKTPCEFLKFFFCFLFQERLENIFLQILKTTLAIGTLSKTTKRFGLRLASWCFIHFTWRTLSTVRSLALFFEFNYNEMTHKTTSFIRWWSCSLEYFF